MVCTGSKDNPNHRGHRPILDEEGESMEGRTRMTTNSNENPQCIWCYEELGTQVAFITFQKLQGCLSKLEVVFVQNIACGPTVCKTLIHSKDVSLNLHLCTIFFYINTG